MIPLANDQSSSNSELERYSLHLELGTKLVLLGNSHSASSVVRVAVSGVGSPSGRDTSRPELADVCALAVPVTEGENELVERSDPPEGEDEEDWLVVSACYHGA